MNLLFPFIFPKRQSLELLAPLPTEIDIRARCFFCIKFNSQQLLFEAFFDILQNNFFFKNNGLFCVNNRLLQNNRLIALDYFW